VAPIIFIPWYAEPTEYRINPPEGWKPEPETLEHADSVEKSSPRWMEGKTVRLEPEQLYFWEVTRKSYTRRGDLGIFLCEYCSRPEEAFRSTNASVVPLEMMEWLRKGETYPKTWEILGPEVNHEVLRSSQDALLRQSRRRL